MTLLSAKTLRDFVADLYRANGLPDGDAQLVAETLVTADLWGHSSHGVMRAPWYIDRLRSGVMRPVTQPRLLVDAGAISVLDAEDGVGQVIAVQAMQDAVRRAKAHGVGVVSVRNSNHHGALGYFTRMAAAKGCIGMLTTNGSPAMAPWGGRKKLVGNNPWSVAAPAGRHAPMMLDIANTVVARGKIFLARQKGQPIPGHWAIDEAGMATTDPVAALNGVIQPMAEHKGYAISVMMDVLSGVLSGSGILDEVSGPYQAERRSRCGHMFLALNIAAFGPEKVFTERMEQMVEQIKAVPRAPGCEEVFYPGEIEAQNEERHRREGLSLPQKTLADLAEVANQSDVPMPAGWPSTMR
ncbi:Ldh family oxidoreductase [Pseudoroseomonas wenyumeiae]|uniref:Ldh family oxidoreductase n=1 Tax=Teichococcus wenyumeiae TaxID=2478470 RepID=A0A3A9JK61_9PROT|nr:Ldh family oxidoreductase [Pseudoroseomonas wenyumeiae]RKK04955.1 Ldh family oxidoreductase [Pseudoroseomonas wenyumeiae]RMI17480.1 Ldh family oxidoreductase [Pseudoroseomonas wenyumeiae]